MAESEKVELTDEEVKRAVGGGAIGTCIKDPANHLASEAFCKDCPKVSRTASGINYDAYSCRCELNIRGSWDE